MGEDDRVMRQSSGARNHLREILTEYDYEPVELLVAAFTLAWGLWILAPLNSFSVAPSFDLLARYMGEQALGWGVAAIGTLSLVAQMYDSRGWLRDCSLLALFGLWTGLLVLFGLSSGWRSTGCATFAVIAVATLLVFLRYVRLLK